LEKREEGVCRRGKEWTRKGEDVTCDGVGYFAGIILIDTNDRQMTVKKRQSSKVVCFLFKTM